MVDIDMLRRLSIFYFFLVVATAFVYVPYYRFDPKVTIHGLVGVLGFAYACYLSFLVVEPHFGERTRMLDRTLAVLSVLLVASFFLKMPALTTAVSAVSFVVFGFMLLTLRRDLPFADRAFTLSSIWISMLCYVYLAYTQYFDTFLGFETRLNYNFLAFSFPLSLIIFSRIMSEFAPSRTMVIWMTTVLVGGVLAMFVGMLLAIPVVEIVSALALIVLIAELVRRAYMMRNIHLFFIFNGLLATGILGFLYLATYLSAGKANMTVLMLHSHFAFFSWATAGIYFLVMRTVGARRFYRRIAYGFLIASLVSISIAFAMDSGILLILSAIFFTVSGIPFLIGFVEAGRITSHF